MLRKTISGLLLAAVVAAAPAHAAPAKTSKAAGAAAQQALLTDRQRVFVLTDIENEPDDAESMVRFLVYSNQWNVEGLVATTSIHQPNKVAAWRIREIVEAYGQVQPNLLLHEPGFPTRDYLMSIIREGLPLYGLKAVGEGHDSPGSELLIERVDASDARPLWVLVWGGPNVLAQALWKVSRTLSARSSSDPDGDTLNYQWFYYGEPGTFTVSAARSGSPVEIKDAAAPVASVTVPTNRVLRNGTMHFVVAVTDSGKPALTRYRRVIVNVQP